MPTEEDLKAIVVHKKYSERRGKDRKDRKRKRASSSESSHSSGSSGEHKDKKPETKTVSNADAGFIPSRFLKTSDRSERRRSSSRRRDEDASLISYPGYTKDVKTRRDRDEKHDSRAYERRSDDKRGYEEEHRRREEGRRDNRQESDRRDDVRRGEEETERSGGYGKSSYGSSRREPERREPERREPERREPERREPERREPERREPERREPERREPERREPERREPERREPERREPERREPERREPERREPERREPERREPERREPERREPERREPERREPERREPERREPERRESDRPAFTDHRPRRDEDNPRDTPKESAYRKRLREEQERTGIKRSSSLDSSKRRGKKDEEEDYDPISDEELAMLEEDSGIIEIYKDLEREMRSKQYSANLDNIDFSTLDVLQPEVIDGAEKRDPIMRLSKCGYSASFGGKLITDKIKALSIQKGIYPPLLGAVSANKKTLQQIFQETLSPYVALSSHTDNLLREKLNQMSRDKNVSEIILTEEPTNNTLLLESVKLFNQLAGTSLEVK